MTQILLCNSAEVPEAGDNEEITLVHLDSDADAKGPSDRFWLCQGWYKPVCTGVCVSIIEFT